MKNRKNGIICLTSLCGEKMAKLYEKSIYKISSDENSYNNNILSVVKYIENNISSDDILDMIKRNKIGFNSNSYDRYRNNIEEHDHFIINPFTIEEGVVVCGKCGCNKTFSYAKQIRSGDEGTSIFSICSRCQHQWVSSG